VGLLIISSTAVWLHALRQTQNAQQQKRKKKVTVKSALSERTPNRTSEERTQGCALTTLRLNLYQAEAEQDKKSLVSK
jgi:uncharacterized membrane protein